MFDTLTSVNADKVKLLVLGLNYTPEPSGVAPYTTNLAVGLSRKNFKVRVITTHPHYPTWRVYKGHGGWRNSSAVNGVSVTRVSHYIPSTPSNLKRFLSEISFGLRVLLEPWGRPDVVLLVSPALFSSTIAAMKCRILFRKTPVAVWVQDLYSLGIQETRSGGGRTARIVTWFESITLRKSSLIIGIHDRFKNHMVNVLRVDDKKIRVVRNWSHLLAIRTTDRESWRNRLGWGKNEFVVLHAGNQGKKQGLGNLIEAARIASEQSLPLRFVLLGDGNQRSNLEHLSEGVSTIQFIDPLPDEDFQHAMSASDALIVNELPDLKEMAVPSKLTSYFSTGLPVIGATDESSITAEELTRSGAGLIVEPANPEALIQAVLRLKGNPMLSNNLGEAGLRYRNEILGQDSAIKSLGKILLELTSSAQRSATSPRTVQDHS